ncbi:chorismate mutase [Chloroflexota bacterium]
METGKTYSTKDTTLELLRTRIDECDKQIIELLRRRFELVRKIGTYKANFNLPVLDERRERELIADRRQQASELNSDLVESLFNLIINKSRQIQADVKKESGS